MKILKRNKGLLRFRTTGETITLKEGENELTSKEFKLIKSHPMYDALVKTSGLVIVAKKVELKKENIEEAKKVELKKENIEEAKREEFELEIDKKNKSEIKEDISEDGIDLSDIDLEDQDKGSLVKIANSLEIKTKGLNNKQIIDKIKAAK